MFKQGRLPGFEDFDTGACVALREPDADVVLTYLGTAGFIVQSAERVVVLDPYLTRSTLWQTLTRPLVPNAELIRRIIPHADDVLVGHAHYDHVLDAPDLCLQTGARLIGSPAVMNVARAAGVPERQLRSTLGHERIACGSISVVGLPSLHGKAILGRIPFPGDIEVPPPWPARVHQLRHGQVLNWWLDAGGFRVVHIDSADFSNEHLRGLHADVVCLCAVGRQHRRNYVRDIVDLLKPRYILPCHWDSMMTPLHATPQLIPGVDLHGMMHEIRELGVTPLLTPIMGEQHFRRIPQPSAELSR